MELDRGVLARLDRKLLAGLGQDESYRMVRVPATAAKWSTWKRYCDSAGTQIAGSRALVGARYRSTLRVICEVVRFCGQTRPRSRRKIESGPHTRYWARDVTVPARHVVLGC